MKTSQIAPLHLRNIVVGFVIAVALALGGFGWSQSQQLDQLRERLASPACYTAFGNIYQQCLVDWMPQYDGLAE